MLRAFTSNRGNNEILGKKSWLMRHHQVLQIDRARKRAAVLARDEHKFSRLFVRGDQRAAKICWNAAAAAANTWRRPGDRFAQDIFPAENGREARRQRKRQFHRHAEIGRSIQFFPGQPDLRFHRAQNLWRKVEEGSYADQKDHQGKDGIEVHESESAKHRSVFAETQSNVRKWLRRRVCGEARSRLCSVRHEARPASKQRDDYCKYGTRMAKYLNREQSAADRANHGMNGIPRGVDPRNLVREKFEKIENAGDRNNRRVAQDF